MSDTRAGGRVAFFLLGAAIGAATALLIAPASGARTRRKLRRQGEEVADYLIGAGKELVDKCEDLCERSGDVVEDATHELSGKYRALRNKLYVLIHFDISDRHRPHLDLLMRAARQGAARVLASGKRGP